MDTSKVIEASLEYTRPNLAEMMRWLRANMNENEELHIYQWHGQFFYIEVMDKRKERFPCHTSRMLIGFTVDMAKDKILWNDSVDETEGLSGNCWVRSSRWKAKQRIKNIGPSNSTNTRIHYYKDAMIRARA